MLHSFNNYVYCTNIIINPVFYSIFISFVHFHNNSVDNSVLYSIHLLSICIFCTINSLLSLCFIVQLVYSYVDNFLPCMAFSASFLCITIPLLFWKRHTKPFYAYCIVFIVCFVHIAILKENSIFWLTLKSIGCKVVLSEKEREVIWYE